jgi:hypothetical protein
MPYQPGKKKSDWRRSVRSLAYWGKVWLPLFSSRQHHHYMAAHLAALKRRENTVSIAKERERQRDKAMARSTLSAQYLQCCRPPILLPPSHHRGFCNVFQ